MARFKVYSSTPYYERALSSRASGADVDLDFLTERLDAASVGNIDGAVGVCVGSQDVLDTAVLESLAAQRCRLIAFRSAGFNNIDLEVAANLGMTVVRVPAYSPYAVAEHAVALLLALARHLPQARDRVRSLDFSLDGLVGFDLHGRTVGVIGTGRIGRVMAGILKGFGMRVLASDPFPDVNWATAEGVDYLPVAQLLSQSDVVTLHAPLMAETRHLINRDALSTMKRGALLINVGRGGLIDTSSVIDALKSGQLGGAAMDVYEHESGVFLHDLSGSVLQDDTLARLLTFPNVIITSHQAFLTQDALDEIANTTVTNMERLTAGEPALPGTQLIPEQSAS